ncbi:MAG: prephenate dehydratase [Magnetococcales bacterium]|nr:prephenate dehydratase [Magnetococcales bacterium]
MSARHDDSDLFALRRAIDSIDDRIHDLLMERTEKVMEVGRIKGSDPDRETPFYRPEREADIHRRLEARHRGPLPKVALHRIWREIISASLSLEKKLSVVYLGSEAAFAHRAALKQFGSSFALVPAATIDELFREVEAKRADYGVAPVENSSEGMVTHTLDRFVDSPLSICGEVYLSTTHALLSMESAMERIHTVYATSLAASQCGAWLERRLPAIRVRGVESTAAAVGIVCREAGSAAIASPELPDAQGLVVLAKHIEDRADENRFLVIGRQGPGRSGRDKTSLLFFFRDQPGFLYQVLGIFARRGLNLTRIESRPSRKQAWEYLFFLDLAGHRDDPPVAGALEELAAMVGVTVKVLGSYPECAL